MKLFSYSIFALLFTGVVSRSFAAEPVIARVGDSEVTYAEIKPAIDALTETDRATLAKDPSLLGQTVRTLVLERLLAKEATLAGWDKSPEVTEKLARLREKVIAETYLQSIAKVPESYPSETEITTFYEARKADLVIPKQYRLAQIFVAAPKDADKATDEKAKAKIESLQKTLKQPHADFSAVAREQSEERETAARRGEIGWLAESSIQPEIRPHVTALSKGNITAPVRLGDGYYLVWLIDVREAHTATIDEVRSQLIRAMRAERLRLNREGYLSKLQQQNPIAVDELGLFKLIESGEAAMNNS